MIDPWLAMLLVKMAVAAGVVVFCSLLAERSGPMVAAMIATLPISAGPVYVFLALEHDPAFIAAGALGSMGSNLANASLSLVYVLLAQRFGTWLSLGSAVAAWLVTALILRAAAAPVVVMACATVLVFAVLQRLLLSYRWARPNNPAPPPWFAIPLRALAVASLTGTVTTVSSHVGPVWSGALAALPLVLTSLIAILQPRIGGPAMAAVIANSALGLMGFGLALGSVHLSAVALGSGPALALGLAICIAWNLSLMRLQRGARRPSP